MDHSEAPALNLPAATLPKGGGAIRGIGEKTAVNPARGTLSLQVPVASVPGRSGFGVALELGYDSGSGNSAFGLGWSLPVAAIARKTDRGVPRYTDTDTFVMSGAEDLVPDAEPLPDETFDGRTWRVRRYRPRVEEAFARIERLDDPQTGETFWRTLSRDNVRSVFGRTARVADPADPTRVLQWLLESSGDDRGNTTEYEYTADGAQRHLSSIRNCAHFLIRFEYADRPDPFTSHRGGFALRTTRRCTRIAVYHDFPDEFADGGPSPRLVRSTELSHDDDPAGVHLLAVTSAGHVWQGDAYLTESAPPLRFEYTVSEPEDVVRTVAAENLPSGVDAQLHHWIDVDGEGIPGALTQQGGAWFYKRNEGGGRLGALERLPLQPSAAADGGGVSLVDLAGDGSRALVRHGPALHGFAERTADGGWTPFQPFRAHPAAVWAEPGLEQVDLDGDGVADLLLVDGEQVRWYPSRGRDGYGEQQRGTVSGPLPPRGERGESLLYADMSGDGLADLVRVANGSVCYWPNLGHGRFGPVVVMAGAPRFDHPDQFDPARVRLADIDGSGTTDLLYLGRGAVTYWVNQSGNGFSSGRSLAAVPDTDRLEHVEVVDLLGTGTSCLVWSSPKPAEHGRPLRYVDLCGRKGNLLHVIDGGAGSQTRIAYASSTQHYLEDRAAGRPWATRLHFPVQVVAQVSVFDHVSRTQLATSYRYRHGHFDAAEREFRGFGFVEQTDVETFPLFDAQAQTELHRPPVRTRSWFHLGGAAEEGFAAEFFAADAPLPQSEPAGDLPPDEHRQALRALAGRPLRTEVYADDGSPQAGVPYTVTEHRYRVHRLAPAAGANGHAVFRWHALETLSTHYERDPADPRIGHEIVLETDAYNTVLRKVSIGYPRRVPQLPEQARRAAVRTTAEVAHVDTAAVRRLAVPVQALVHEVDLPTPAGARYTVAEAGAGAPARLLSHTRTRYWDDALAAPLPLGQVGTRALPHQAYRLAFTAALLAEAYQGRVDDAMLAEAGHVAQDGSWWLPSGVQHFDPALFYLPVRQVSPFGNTASVEYDAYGLLPVRSRQSASPGLDALVATARVDYRVLAAEEVTDPNGNRERVAFDALGRVSAAWTAGRDDTEGDPADLPGAEFSYGHRSWSDGQGPVWARTRVRERHGDVASPWQESTVYCDGTGRIVMTKQQAAPDGDGPRWVGSGRTVFDNKGRPVKQYEPYFSATAAFEDEPSLVAQGVTSLLHYDPVGRLVRTEHPDGTLSRSVIGPWRSEAWDRNDTVADSLWFAERGSPDRAGPEPADPQQRAAWLAAAHAATPTVTRTDSLGRVVRSAADGGALGPHETVTELDVQGRVVSVTDPRGIVVQTQRYDLTGRVVGTRGPDAGERRQLPDPSGTPVRTWDGVHRAHHLFDDLRRPVRTLVAPEGGGAWRTVTATWYGEGHPSAVPRNLLGRPAVALDGAGLTVTVEHDFKGNLLVARRRLVADPTAEPDWSGLDALAVAEVEPALGAVLEAEVHQTATGYDALNRPVTEVLPDGTVTSYGYDEGGRLDTVRVKPAGAAGEEPYVREIGYDAKGRRQHIVYGNFVRTRYTFDEPSQRLVRVETFRSGAPGQPLQDLSYTHDPVGNIVEVHDGARQPHFYAGALTEPVSRYTYDPLYRLVSATGREHESLGAEPGEPAFGKPIPHPNDAVKLRAYTQEYEYDRSGNMTRLRHSAGAGSYTREHAYAADSNRMLGVGHDTHGNMVQIPGMGPLSWDYADRLAAVDLAGGGTARYAYAGAQRVRKTLTRTGGLVEERIYLGPYEIHRRLLNGAVVFRRTTVHVLDGATRIAMIERKTVDGGPAGETRVRYQLGNHLSSCLLEVDGSASALVIAYEEYHPFGSTALWLGSGGIEVSDRRYRYTGKEKDAETGLYYHGARYYAPWLARWTAADPIGLQAGTNVYAYVGGNPVRLHDPTGTQDKPAWQEVLTNDQGARYYVREDTGAYRRDTAEFKEGWLEGGAQEVAFAPQQIVGNLKKPISAQEAETPLKDPKDVHKEWAKEELAKRAAEEARLKALEEAEQAQAELEAAEAAKAEEEGMLDALQTGIDVVGLIPGVGDVADVVNAGISLARGNYGEAALSMAAAIPFAGGAAVAAKWAKKGLKAQERTVKAAELINKGRKVVGKEAEIAEDAAALVRSGVPKQDAGSFFHEAMGYAGPGGGADKVGKGVQKEVKTHFGPMYDWQFQRVENQSMRYTQKYAEANGGLYPIRIVEHVYIDIKTGFAIKFSY